MGKTKREKGELRTMAAKAKSRLKSGYWANIQKERDCARQTAQTKGVRPEAVNDFYRNKVTLELKRESNPEADELYIKVCALLDTNQDIINPIGQLIDKQKYDSLDTQSKQRYIMNLAAKYQELSARYYSEKRIDKGSL